MGTELPLSVVFAFNFHIDTSHMRFFIEILSLNHSKSHFTFGVKNDGGNWLLHFLGQLFIHLRLTKVLNIRLWSKKVSSFVNENCTFYNQSFFCLFIIIINKLFPSTFLYTLEAVHITLGMCKI